MASRISGGMEAMETVLVLLTLSVPKERRRMIVFKVRSSGDMTASEACMSADGAIVSRKSLERDILAQKRDVRGVIRKVCAKQSWACSFIYNLNGRQLCILPETPVSDTGYSVLAYGA